MQATRKLANRAKQLNPNHPGWYWFADFYDAYQKREYRNALGFALKVNLPRHFATYMMTAAAYGQLGEKDEARKVVRNLRELRLNFGGTVRAVVGKGWQLEPMEHLPDGLRKAGLEIPDEPRRR